MENVYEGDWSCLDDMLRDFGISKDEIKGYKVLYAWYEYAFYSGSAFVLLKKGRKLYEVNGGHCSCYGLENQFDLEETTVEALLKCKHLGVDPEVVKGLVEKLNNNNLKKLL